MLSSCLAFLKQRLERPESIAIIMDDKQAKTILAVWQVMRHPVFADIKILEKEADVWDLYDKIWKRNPFLDFSELSRLSSIPLTVTQKIFYSLRDLFLLWPDGTIAEQAKKLLIADQAAYLNERTPRWRQNR